jgi:hypothetical protein
MSWFDQLPSQDTHVTAFSHWIVAVIDLCFAIPTKLEASGPCEKDFNINIKDENPHSRTKHGSNLKAALDPKQSSHIL